MNRRNVLACAVAAALAPTEFLAEPLDPMGGTFSNADEWLDHPGCADGLMAAVDYGRDDYTCVTYFFREGGIYYVTDTQMVEASHRDLSFDRGIGPHLRHRPDRVLYGS